MLQGCGDHLALGDRKSLLEGRAAVSTHIRLPQTKFIHLLVNCGTADLQLGSRWSDSPSVTPKGGENDFTLNRRTDFPECLDRTAGHVLCQAHCRPICLAALSTDNGTFV